MIPQSVKKVSNNECDVAYTYDPAPGTIFSSGRDIRRFTFKRNFDSACDWKVDSMGGYNSGTTITEPMEYHRGFGYYSKADCELYSKSACENQPMGSLKLFYPLCKTGYYSNGDKCYPL